MYSNDYSLINEPSQLSNNIKSNDIKSNNCKIKDNKFKEFEEEEFYIPDNKEDNTNYIFINDIKDYLEINNYPNFNLLIKLYINKFKFDISKLNNKIGLYFITIIYILFILFILFGWLLPTNLLNYYILVCILFLLSLENTENYSMYNKIIKYFYNKNIVILPFSYKLIKQIILFLIIISFFSLFNKNYNPYALLKYIILLLDKYN